MSAPPPTDSSLRRFFAGVGAGLVLAGLAMVWKSREFMVDTDTVFLMATMAMCIGGGLLAMNLPRRSRGPQNEVNP